MPEMKSDNSPETQYYVLQNKAETNLVCHDGILFHWTKQKKQTKKKKNIPATQEQGL